MDLILVSGLWLDHSAWDDVVPALEAAGHRPTAPAVPGQDGSAATLEHQVRAVVAAIDSAADRPVVVGHSAAATLAWLAADARPDRVAGVVTIGGWPVSDGERYGDVSDVEDGVMPFPGWGPFEGPDAADLDDTARERIAARMQPVPEGVSRAVVRYADDRRLRVPVVLVCPEFSPDQARAWIDGGDLPELARVERVDLVDIDSGHWPMFSTPADLARVLGEAAQRIRG
ncbi:MAG: alpha/beta fold hydrolase [Phycicoccus sp.]